MHHAFVAAGNFPFIGCGGFVIVAVIASALHATLNTKVTTTPMAAVVNVVNVLMEY